MKLFNTTDVTGIRSVKRDYLSHCCSL